MVIAANEHAETLASDFAEKARWITPEFQRLEVGEAAGGDSFTADTVNTS